MRAVIFTTGVALGAGFAEKPIAAILAAALTAALLGMAIYREATDDWRNRYVAANQTAAELEAHLAAYESGDFRRWLSEMEADS